VIDHPRLPRLIVRYIAFVVTALLVISVIAVNQAASNRADTLHQAALTTCQGQNVIRFALSGYFKAQIVQTKHVSYSQFFPTIPKQQLHKIRRNQIHQLTQIIHDLKPLDCERVTSGS
jgi:hypothetical protein